LGSLPPAAAAGGVILNGSGRDRAARTLIREVMMSEPIRKPEHAEIVGMKIGRPPLTLERLMAGKKPITSWDELDIPDLTDEERAAFADALAGD
jgi:hypothetical protein